MRQECKNFESRTYANGETVRKCNLDLAPDAPWRCPDNCPAFEPRMDAGWTYGSMVAPPTPPEPPGLDDGSAAAILDEAEDFLNSIGAAGDGRGRHPRRRDARACAGSSAGSATTTDQQQRRRRPHSAWSVSRHPGERQRLHKVMARARLWGFALPA